MATRPFQSQKRHTGSFISLETVFKRHRFKLPLRAFCFCSFLCIVLVHIGGTPGDGESAEQDMLPPTSGRGKT